MQVSLRVDPPRSRDVISHVMSRVRATAPQTLGGVEVTEVIDLEDGALGLAPSEGLIWRLGTKGRVVVRPSGTEPKLKAYLEVVGTPSSESLHVQRESVGAILRDVETDVRRLLDLDA
jgi:phosphomannomutase